MRTAIRASLLSVLLVSACATARVSTPEERAFAHQTLTNVETGVTIAFAAGKLTQEEFQAAIQQVADLRNLVNETETTAMSWADVTQRIANLAVQWLIEPPQEGS